MKAHNTPASFIIQCNILSTQHYYYYYDYYPTIAKIYRNWLIKSCWCVSKFIMKNQNCTIEIRRKTCKNKNALKLWKTVLKITTILYRTIVISFMWFQHRMRSHSTLIQQPRIKFSVRKSLAYRANKSVLYQNIVSSLFISTTYMAFVGREDLICCEFMGDREGFCDKLLFSRVLSYEDFTEYLKVY